MYQCTHIDTYLWYFKSSTKQQYIRNNHKKTLKLYMPYFSNCYLGKLGNNI